MSMNKLTLMFSVIVMFIVSYPVAATHDYKLEIQIMPGNEQVGKDGKIKVGQVRPGGIGDKSGLKTGDLIVSYAGYKFKIANPRVWKRPFEESKKHHLIKIEIIRGSKRLTLTVDNRTNAEIQSDYTKKFRENQRLAGEKQKQRLAEEKEKNSPEGKLRLAEEKKEKEEKLAREEKKLFYSFPAYGDGDCPEGTTGKWACNAETYVGDKKDGVPHGNGKFTWKDGSWYLGEVANGYITGSGTYDVVVEVYVGELKGGKFHGVGTYLVFFYDEQTVSVYGPSGYYVFMVGEWKNDGMWNGYECDQYATAIRHWEEGVQKTEAQMKQLRQNTGHPIWHECKKAELMIGDLIKRKKKERVAQLERENQDKRRLAEEKRKKKEEEKQATYKKNKPTIDLASAYDSYLWVKGCYEARKGYAVGFIVENQMTAAKEQIRAVEDAITSQHPTIDSNRVWNSTVKSTGDVKWIVEQGATNDWKTTEEMCGVHKCVLEQFAKEWGAPVEKKKDF